MPQLLLVILAVSALLLTIASAVSPPKCPLWVPVFLCAFILVVLVWK